MKKSRNSRSYDEVCSLYKNRGLLDYQFRTPEDILYILNISLEETPGYPDLTEEQKKLFIQYALTHMNHVGMEVKMTMRPKSVHFVKELTYCAPEEWDEELQCATQQNIGQEFVIVKADGTTKKFKKYGYTEKGENAVVAKTIERKYLRVDWKYQGHAAWFHVQAPNEYY